MFLKTRRESEELRILTFLDNRMMLSDQEKNYYLNLKKGYEGELAFDQYIEELECDCLILNDLLFKVNNTVFQIDSLLILSDCLYLFEVKNYEGDYYYESDKIINKKSKNEIVNPLNQLSRTDSLFRQLLQSLGFNFRMEAWVTFINPEFILYQAPLNKPIIFSPQMKRFLKNIETHSSKLTKRHKILSEKLLSLHIERSPYSQLPTYDFDSLQKGIRCTYCNSLSLFIEGRNCVCLKCGLKEKTSQAILRSVKEFKVLFPNEKITTNKIFDWCKIVPNKKRIWEVLDKNFTSVGKNRWIYYE